jgi:hypothetical protein
MSNGEFSTWLALDKCIRILQRHCNINMDDSIQALYKERSKLIKTNRAYADADEILSSIKVKK